MEFATATSSLVRAAIDNNSGILQSYPGGTECITREHRTAFSLATSDPKNLEGYTVNNHNEWVIAIMQSSSKCKVMIAFKENYDAMEMISDKLSLVNLNASVHTFFV